jgi:DNA-binding transcriptional LysR family regulator
MNQKSSLREVPQFVSEVLTGNSPLIFNDIEVCLRAALRGVGLARVPLSMALNYLEKGEIETVLDAYAVEGPGLTLYYPSRSQALPKLRAFAEFARPRMRRDFDTRDYLPTVVKWLSGHDRLNTQ